MCQAKYLKINLFDLVGLTNYLGINFYWLGEISGKKFFVLELLVLYPWINFFDLEGMTKYPEEETCFISQGKYLCPGMTGQICRDKFISPGGTGEISQDKFLHPGRTDEISRVKLFWFGGTDEIYLCGKIS